VGQHYSIRTQALSSPATIQGNTPELRWSEVDQTDPAGRYRAQVSGDEWLLQRAASADWGSATNLIRASINSDGETVNIGTGSYVVGTESLAVNPTTVSDNLNRRAIAPDIEHGRTAGAYTATITSLWATARVQGSPVNDQAWSASPLGLIGAHGRVQVAGGTATITGIAGVVGEIIGVNSTNGTVTNAYAVYADLTFPIVGIASGSTLTNGYDFYGRQATSVTGTFTNAYGLYLEDVVAAGTLNYGIYLAGASTAAIYVAADPVVLANDVFLNLGTDSDIVMLNRSTTLAANTALTNVLIGTPVTSATPVNSLLVSNVTADGDIAFFVNNGGNSLEAFRIDASAQNVIFTMAVTWAGTLEIGNDVLFTLGDDNDIVQILRSTALAADAEVTNVIVGISDHQGVAANSFILSNITTDGDIIMLVSDGGNSLEFLLANADVADLQLGFGMATVSLLSASGDITVNPGASFNVTLTATDADAFTLNDGSTDYYNIDTRSVDTVVAHTFDTTNPSFVSGASTHFHLMGLSTFTWTVTGGVNITTPIDGLGLRILAPIIDSTSATTITQLSTLYVAAADVSDAEITATTNLAAEFDGAVLVSTGSLTAAGAIISQDSQGVFLGTGSDSRLYYDGTDTFWDLRADGTGDLMIALAASFPSPDPEAVHIWRGSAGAIAASTDALLILEDNANVVIQLLSTSSNNCSIFAGDEGVISAGFLQYTHSSDQWTIGTADTNRITITAALVNLATAGMDMSLNAAYFELSEMAAPGAGAANHVRIYGVVDGGSLTDLAAVFQDGTVDIFAQEVTPLDSPIFRYPSGTEGRIRMRKPHPGLQIFEMVYPDGTTFVLKEIEHHDADKIAASIGSEGPLPSNWVVETVRERNARILAEQI